jgi:hypothetical protein
MSMHAINDRTRSHAREASALRWACTPLSLCSSARMQEGPRSAQHIAGNAQICAKNFQITLRQRLILLRAGTTPSRRPQVGLVQARQWTAHVAGAAGLRILGYQSRVRWISSPTNS